MVWSLGLSCEGPGAGLDDPGVSPSNLAYSVILFAFDCSHFICFSPGYNFAQVLIATFSSATWEQLKKKKKESPFKPRQLLLSQYIKVIVNKFGTMTFFLLKYKYMFLIKKIQKPKT